MIPKFLELEKDEDYKIFYYKNYCKKPIITFDGIPIYFKKERFEHAFYESSDRRGSKDIFSPNRARRLLWIKYILQNNLATVLQGWNRKKKIYDPCMRVAFRWDEFVVIVRISFRKDGKIKGNFVTCYLADNSIGKIKKAPKWNKEDCIKNLGR